MPVISAASPAAAMNISVTTTSGWIWRMSATNSTLAATTRSSSSH
jgi:hypothetical protein